MRKVLIFGTFDILHPGHVFFINKAKALGNIIIASVARDKFVKKIKKKLPVNNEDSRKKLLMDKKLVDKAYLSDEIPGTYTIIEKERPEVVCVGYDQNKLYNNLLLWLKKNKLNIKVIQIESFSPEKYKSSKIEEHQIYNTVLNNIDDMVFMAVDVETTGLDPIKDKVVEIGAVLFNKSGIIDTFKRLVNPEISIPEEVIKIHGITNKMVKDAEKIVDVLHQLQAFAHGACPVAHNAYFDVGFLLYDLALNDIIFKNRIVFDTLTISKNVFKNFNSYSLKNLTKKLKIRADSFHRALSDSILCMKLFLKCLEEIKGKNAKKVLDKLLIKNRRKYGNYAELTLSWKNILLKSGLNKIVNALENHSEIEIKYLLTGDTPGTYKIKPYSISIKQNKYVLLAYHNKRTEEFSINKIKMI